MFQSPVYHWFNQQGWDPLPFQLEAWQAIAERKSGILQAAPGTGKTYAIMGGFCRRFLTEQTGQGLRLLWITPLRALATDVTEALTKMVEGLKLPWRVEFRTGDTSTKIKSRQAKQLPEILVITPESLHLLLARSDCSSHFQSLKGVVVDEWHELLGNKRGVQVELALSRLHTIAPHLQLWGISATIGNSEQALAVLCGKFVDEKHRQLIRSDFQKELSIQTWIPEVIERFPWAGHLGLRSIPELIPLLNQGGSTLIFTNTRAQAELWYQTLLTACPDWEPVMGIHHGSLEGSVRQAVEIGLQESKLKIVICTSSLDLGVDFYPVDQVFQVGSPKSIARCLQRAGRSGHRPGEVSSLLFIPTHALEIIEAQALRHAIAQGFCEARVPRTLSFDVLMQYLLTLAVGEGFDETVIYQEIKKTYAYHSLTPQQWQVLLNFLEKGGEALQAYEEYKKIHKEGSLYKLNSIKQARQHRLSIGTMMGSTSIAVRYLKGGPLGSVEEDFATRLKPGDVFWYNGKCLAFVHLREMTVWVRRAPNQPGTVPRWRGGRLPYSSLLSYQLAKEVEHMASRQSTEKETIALRPLLDIQAYRSAIPKQSQLLIETLHSKEGYHVFIYPFKGRMIHEALAQLLAFRLSQRFPMTVSMACNDYGIELLANRPLSFDPIQERELFSPLHLKEDLLTCLKKTELAKHHFREIARVSGLIFTGYPGKNIAQSHLQMSSELLFSVFEKYDPQNLLVQQCYQEVLDYQWNLSQLEEVLNEIMKKEWIVCALQSPTPFSFPLFVERWRDSLSSEQLSDRIKTMSLRLEKEILKPIKPKKDSLINGYDSF
jgi:ATP-dependent helicase Lhr and Lhr-like helicase